jgi:hypothetical protein
MTICVVNDALHRLWHIHFVDIRYFAGPTFWTGANFQLEKNIEENMNLWRSLEPLVADERHLKHIATFLYRLYVVRTPAISIKIVAGDANLSEEHPEAN